MITGAQFHAATPSDVVQFFERWSRLPKKGQIPRLRDYLDTAPPQLQPNVTIVDVHSPDHMTVRLFGTALESVSGLAPTAQNLMTLYAPGVQALARKLVWHTVSHPVGYICTRHVRTGRGLLLDCPSIGLPIGLEDERSLCFITYANISSAAAALSAKDNFAVVEGVRFEYWVDIGAGVPLGPP